MELVEAGLRVSVHTPAHELPGCSLQFGRLDAFDWKHILRNRHAGNQLVERARVGVVGPFDALARNL